jgi:AcrR family transcriptional regulator
MIKDKIIQTAMLFYSRYGIKSVSMNQIANAMSISKRTMYMAFGNKEDILIGCVNHGIGKLNEVVESTTARSATSLEALVQISINVFQYTSSYCPAFYKDIVRYPEATSRLNEYQNLFKEKCYQLFLEGVKEGDFLPDQDYEFITSMYVEQIGRLQAEQQSAMVLTFLGGVCTDKGVKELKKFTPMLTQKKNQSISA